MVDFVLADIVDGTLEVVGDALLDEVVVVEVVVEVDLLVVILKKED